MSQEKLHHYKALQTRIISDHTDPNLVFKILCNHDRKYPGQSLGQGKMAASLLRNVQGILKCLHMDSQQHQHFRASKTIIPISRNYYKNFAGTQ